MSVLLLGSLNLNDRSKYRWTQNASKANWTVRIRDWRGRNSSRLTYRKKSSDTWSYNIICVGPDMATAEENRDALLAELDAAAGYILDREQFPTPVIITEQVGNGSGRQLQVIHGTFDERNQALWALDEPQIHGVLELTLIPLIDRVTPSPVRVRLSVPSILVVPGPAILTPDPIAIPLSIPVPDVGSHVMVSPSPVTIPVAVPAPEVDSGGPRVLLPSPVAIPIAVPTPLVATDVLVTPSPVQIFTAIPVPDVDAGTFDINDVASSFEYWYRAYDLTGSPGDSLATWTDLSSHGRNMTATGTSPVLNDSEFGGKRTVFTDQRRMTFTQIALADVQIFMVLKVTDTLFQGTILRTATTAVANYGFGIRESFGDRAPYFHAYSSGSTSVDKKEENALIGALPFGFHLYRIEADTSGGITNVRRDQVAKTLVSNGTGLSGNEGLNPDQQIDMYIAEIIIARGLTSTQLDQVEQYLMDEAGL